MTSRRGEQEQEAERAQETIKSVVEKAIERQEQQVAGAHRQARRRAPRDAVDARGARLLLLAGGPHRGRDRDRAGRAVGLPSACSDPMPRHAARARQPRRLVWSAGRHEEAIRIEEEVLEATERVLGLDHLDTLTARSNLSFSYASAGRMDDAIVVLAAGARGPHPRARRRRGRDARRALEPRLVAVERRAPRRGDRRRGGALRRGHADLRRRPRGRADRAPRPRVLLSRRRAQRRGTRWRRRAWWPTSSACSASSTRRRRPRSRSSTPAADAARGGGRPALSRCRRRTSGRRSPRRRRQHAVGVDHRHATRVGLQREVAAGGRRRVGADRRAGHRRSRRRDARDPRPRCRRASASRRSARRRRRTPVAGSCWPRSTRARRRPSRWPRAC